MERIGWFLVICIRTVVGATVLWQLRVAHFYWIIASKQHVMHVYAKIDGMVGDFERPFYLQVNHFS